MATSWGRSRRARAHPGSPLAPRVGPGRARSFGRALVPIAAPDATTTPPPTWRVPPPVTFGPLPAGHAGSLHIDEQLSNVYGRATSQDQVVTVRNLGPGAVGGPGQAVVAEGLLPPGSTMVGGSGASWSCTPWKLAPASDCMTGRQPQRAMASSRAMVTAVVWAALAGPAQPHSSGGCARAPSLHVTSGYGWAARGAEQQAAGA